MKLPLAISVPHSGLRVPDEVADRCILSSDQIAKDGDVGAAEIYAIADAVETFASADVARAIVDLNRAEDDRSRDGAIKTHTCWNEPVYREPLEEALAGELVRRYHRPYHERLTAFAQARVRLAVDCHTMAAHGPPVGPDPGRERPWVCLSHADGTCPDDWLERLAGCMERAFGRPPTINTPFRGGYIVRTHAAEMPWVQLELSRAPFMSDADKRQRVLQALTQWCDVASAG